MGDTLCRVGDPPGRLLDLGTVHMRPASHLGLGAHGTPMIRVQPIKPNEIPGIDPSHTWAWALVQCRPGEPDALLLGGTSESLSAAQDEAREAFQMFELRWARESGRIERT